MPLLPSSLGQPITKFGLDSRGMDIDPTLDGRNVREFWGHVLKPSWSAP